MFKKYKINTGIDILKNWQTIDSKKLDRLIRSFYSILDEERKKHPPRRWMPIFPHGVDIDNIDDLLDRLRQDIGEKAIVELIVFLLENDRRFENTDTLENYKKNQPYPSFLIEYAYILLFRIPKESRTRKLFETLWEHQAKIRPGINEQITIKMLNLFSEVGITTQKEIRELLIKDWLRWQRSPKDSPYYGAALGPSSFYFPNYSWGLVEKKLEEHWRKDTGKEPKKWGE